MVLIKDKNMDTTDNMRLTYSWITFNNVPHEWYINKFYSRISQHHVVNIIHISVFMTAIIYFSHFIFSIA
jgi:cytochrome c oxidase assembly factor CtaG